MTQPTMDIVHPADSDILRFHDGECGAEERNGIAAHIAECSACAETSSLFQDTTRQLHDTLEDMPTPPVVGAKERFLAAVRQNGSTSPVTRSFQQRTPWLRAAVVIFGALVVSMWAPPVRAWFFRLISPEPPVAAETEVPAQNVPAPSLTSSVVSFVPTASTFVVDVITRQDHGRLTLHVVRDRAASATITGRSEADALLVMQDGFRIQNTASSSATYVVMVPLDVQRVIVRVGSTQIQSFSTDQIAAGDSVVIDISRQ